jgi:hypothetical protein
MNGPSSSDSMADPTAPSQHSPSAQPQLPAISEAPDAGMLHNHTLALLMMQQMAMPQFLFSPFIHMPPLAEVTHTPFGPIQMPQQSLVALSTPRRAYLKRKRETPTPKRSTAATTPAQAAGEPTEAYPEVNFNDHSAYKRLLSSVWDFKGDPPWSRYSVQQVLTLPPLRAATPHLNLTLIHTPLTPPQLIDIVKTPSSWAPEWDGQVTLLPALSRPLFY